MFPPTFRPRNLFNELMPSLNKVLEAKLGTESSDNVQGRSELIGMLPEGDLGVSDNPRQELLNKLIISYLGGGATVKISFSAVPSPCGHGDA